MNFTEDSLFWGFVVIYGVVIFIFSPKSKNTGSFYRGADDQGNPANTNTIRSSLRLPHFHAPLATLSAID